MFDGPARCLDCKLHRGYLSWVTAFAGIDLSDCDAGLVDVMQHIGSNNVRGTLVLRPSQGVHCPRIDLSQEAPRVHLDCAQHGPENRLWKAPLTRLIRVILRENRALYGRLTARANQPPAH